MRWIRSHRADPEVVPLADRHYNRQKIGTPQFAPPGRCLVLKTAELDAFWITSWPFAEYVKHAWAGAWVCSAFRNESAHLGADAAGAVFGTYCCAQARKEMRWKSLFTRLSVTQSRWIEPKLGLLSAFASDHEQVTGLRPLSCELTAVSRCNSAPRLMVMDTNRRRCRLPTFCGAWPRTRADCPPTRA